MYLASEYDHCCFHVSRFETLAHDREMLENESVSAWQRSHLQTIMHYLVTLLGQGPLYIEGRIILRAGWSDQ